MSGKLIVVEGIEGAGKTSIVERIITWLKEVQGVEALTFREPGSTPIGEAVRTLIKHPDSDISVETQTELLWLARRRLLEDVVQPLLDEGKWVILDRYWMSTLAYQWDYYSSKPLYPVIEEIVDTYQRPDFMFYLDVSPKVAKKRCTSGVGRGNVADKNDDAPLSTFTMWHRRYGEIVSAYDKIMGDSNKTLVINADQTFSMVADDVIFALNQSI